MSLAKLVPWWAKRRRPDPERASAEELEQKLNAHMKRLRSLTTTLEAEITQMRGEDKR